MKWKVLGALVAVHVLGVTAAHAVTLSTTYIGEGSINPPVGVHSFGWGSKVTITATPVEDWVFDHWEGDLSGSSNPKSLRMWGNRRVTAAFRPITPTPANALARYVGKLDPNYDWFVHDIDIHFGWTKHTLVMTSQQWRDGTEVDRPIWDHDLGIIEPWFSRNNAALFINGGSNGGPPAEVDSALALIAFITGMVYVQLDQVPNQPLFFADEVNNERVEDEILAYSLDKYLVTGDDEWPVHVAMTKAAIRAMDTVQDYLLRGIKDFFVVGGSKRGWTTYLAAAIDPRIQAMAPISIDIPDFEENTRHHFEAYGFYTPAVQDYVEFDLFCRVDTPEGMDLLQIVDPLAYFPKYTMPKLIVNSAGDQFFLPDSSRFYWALLPGWKNLRYTVNTDHSQEQDLTALITTISWADKAMDNEPLPDYDWTFEADGSIRVQTYTTVQEVTLWQAHNPNARDFRLETIGAAWTSSPLTDQGGGVYIGFVPEPAQGWSAFLVELTFDDGIILTTEVAVTPDVLPFEGQACLVARSFAFF